MLGILRACVSLELVSVHRTEPAPVITWCLCGGVASFAHSGYSQRPEERGYAWLLVSWTHSTWKTTAPADSQMVCCMYASFLCQWSERESLHQTFPCFLLAAATRAVSPTLVPPEAAHTWHASIVLKSSQGGKGGGGGGIDHFSRRKKSSVSRFTANKKRHFTFQEKRVCFICEKFPN